MYALAAPRRLQTEESSHPCGQVRKLPIIHAVEDQTS